MDNTADAEALRAGAQSVGVALSDDAIRALLVLRDELLKWNQRVNLTAITDPREVLEKHFVDSLAVLPELEGAASLLDIGAGAGFPGIPLKLARPDLDLTLVDSIGKKVSFMKSALVKLKLTRGARALHTRAGGHPSREGIPLADIAISRAFMDVSDWVPLAAHYLTPGGRVVSMMGRAPTRDELRRAEEGSALRLISMRAYRLPWSGAQRTVGVFGR